MTLIKRLALASLLLAGVSGAGIAQEPHGPPCINRDTLIAHLHTLFKEQAAGSGLADGGFIFELFVGPSGSWTAFATTPQGMSCYLASGEGWDPLPQPDIFAGR